MVELNAAESVVYMQIAFFFFFLLFFLRAAALRVVACLQRGIDISTSHLINIIQQMQPEGW